MNKVILNFYVVKSNQNYEVSFDSRLSFKENFKLLNDLSFVDDIDECYIVDFYSDYPLNKTLPISVYGINDYTRLYIL